MMFVAVLSMVLVEQSLAVIYRINETEYRRMPALFAMDDYTECMLEPGGTYCVADYDLSSREHSDLMHFIREYSANKLKHFNHTKIHRGTCVTISCRDHFNTLNKTGDLEEVLGACLNESLWKSHKLEASLSEIQYCKKAEDKTVLDLSDFIVAAIYAFIILMNFIGTFYDIILCEKDNKTGNPYLLAFSIRRNWAKLTAPGGSGPDARMERLKIFNGLRTMTIGCVIFAHCSLILTFSYIANPHYIEKTYDDLSKQILYNGNLVTFTFFVMSSFLLAYNLQIQSEKTEITWRQIPKGILLRWLRLTPPYALVLATISTWMRHLGSGPLWDLVVVSEAHYCRQYWWAHVLYFNNYIHKYDICFPQGWYLAADTQLFTLSLVLLVLVKKPHHRKLLLILMFLVSLVITAAHTYFQDLDAIIMQEPESFRSLYRDAATYRLVYIRGHTNLSVYTLGLAGGLLVYRWQTDNKDLSIYKKYSWILFFLVPLGLCIILSGGIFYVDGATPSTLLRVAYATLYKPAFQILVLIYIINSIFKFEKWGSSIAEWRGFTWGGRVSYSAFLLHSLFQRALAGAQTAPLVISDYFVEYSQKTTTHYNHTKIRYSVCVSKYCQPYIRNRTPVTSASLEGCLNDIIRKDYRLMTKVEKYDCHTSSDDIEVDTSDIIVAVVLLSILLLNIIGSITDMKCESDGVKERSMLSCFSIPRNWKNLVKITEHADPRLRRLKGINFWRCFIPLVVILVHCAWPFLIAVENSYDLEMSYKTLWQQFVLNGAIGLQMYMVISGFLISYKMELYSESKPVGWRMVPIAVMMRYFRITPVYAAVIAVMATWTKFIGPGPFWEVSAGLVRAHCRSRWWENLLYINNYFYNSQCLVGGWYLGVDMQMFVFGMITCVALRHRGRRAAALASLFIIGIIILAVHIYVRDLDAIAIFAPDEARTLFETDPTVNETYKMGHANVSSYVVGLAAGYLVYRLQQQDVDIKKYRKYRIIYWALPAVIFGIILAGSVFSRDAPRDPIYIRVLYGALVKPVFGIVSAALICGAIFKLENVYRRVLEWRGWAVPARLSYCVYVVHLPALRIFLACRTTLLTASTANQLLLLLCIALASLAVALPLWLLVEAPFVELTKHFSSTRTTSEEKEGEITNGAQEKKYSANTRL